jgi:hypothetical protein
MLKKTITFEDLDGNEVTEDFYFNLGKAELAEMALSVEGGLEEYLRTIIKANENSVILAAFKDIIAKSVGQRSEDGRRFIRDADIVGAFMESAAYGELLIELVSDVNKASEFVNGILPASVTRGRPVEDVRPKEYTEKELLEMSQAEFDRVVGTDPRSMTRDHMVIAMQRRTRQPA